MCPPKKLDFGLALELPDTLFFNLGEKREPLCGCVLQKNSILDWLWSYRALCYLIWVKKGKERYNMAHKDPELDQVGFLT